MCVCVADSPEVTDVGLRHLNSLPGLWVLILKDQPSFWLTDTKLQGLHNNSQLRFLRLGYSRPIQMNITAAAITRSVRLHTHTGSCMPIP